MNTNQILISLVSEPNTKNSTSESTLPIPRLHSKFTLIQIQSSNLIQNIPSTSITTSKNFIITHILAYKLSAHGKFQIEINLAQNSTIPVPRFTQQRIIFPKLTKKKELKIFFCCPIPQNFYLNSQNSSFKTKNSQFCIKSVHSLPEKFSISQCLTDFESTLSLESADKLLYTIINKELVTRKVMKLENKITKLRFQEISKSSQHLKKLQIEVCIKKKIILVEYRVLLELPGKKIDSFPSSSLNKLQAVIRLINKKTLIGRFYVNNTVCYSTSFHSSLITRVNMSLYTLIQKDIQLIFSYCPQFYQIFLESSNFSIEGFILDISLEGESKSVFSKKEMKLAPNDYYEEQKIKEALDKSKDLYFINRFQNKKITFLDNWVVTYQINAQSEDFESFAQEFPNDAIESIFSLIDELEKFGLRFKNDHFPINYFKWYEEKLIYTYKLPLCQILELKEQQELKKYSKKFSESQEAMDIDENVEEMSAIKKNFLFQTMKFHSVALDKRHLVYSFEEILTLSKKSEFVQMDEAVAKGRLALYESVAGFPGVRKYKGLCSIGTKTLLVCSKAFSYSFESVLFTHSEIVNALTQLVELIKSLTVKNTFFSCFDSDCLGFNQKNQLKIEIRIPEEINNDFKPPEVRFGRSHRSSLLYSFGKIVEHCYFIQFCTERLLHPQSLIKLEVLPEIYQKIPWLQQLILGCTDPKVGRRWNIFQLKQHLLSHLQN